MIVCSIILLMGACTHKDVPVKENMLKNKSFVYLYYPTLKDCLDSQPDPDFFYNCHQQVDFYPDYKVEIMLTDIYWRGSYKVMGDLIILTFEPNHEIPDGEIIFKMLNPAKILHAENGTVWKKMSGDSIWK